MKFIFFSFAKDLKLITFDVSRNAGISNPFYICCKNLKKNNNFLKAISLKINDFVRV